MQTLRVYLTLFLLQGVLPEAFEKVDNAEIKEIIEGCIRNKKGSRYVRKF